MSIIDLLINKPATTGSMASRSTAGKDLNVRSARLLNWGAAVLVLIVLAATTAILLTMRKRAVSEASRELKSLSLVLADQLDRNIEWKSWRNRR
jgi:hypothetical protein